MSSFLNQNNLHEDNLNQNYLHESDLNQSHLHERDLNQNRDFDFEYHDFDFEYHDFDFEIKIMPSLTILFKAVRVPFKSILLFCIKTWLYSMKNIEQAVRPYSLNYNYYILFACILYNRIV